jgi:glycerate 2-kinase
MNGSPRETAGKIFEAGLRAVDSYAAVQKSLRLQDRVLTISETGYSFDTGETGGIFVIGFGKGAARMAKAAENALGRHIRDGLVLTKYGHDLPLERIRIIPAGHPIPDTSGIRGTEHLLNLVERTGPHDLILGLISGGGSALLTSPWPPVTLADLRQLNQQLLDVGADIHEINTLRKHLSRVKGGRLAAAAFPTPMAVLILSDVIGDPPDVIASGPTVPDPTTFADCLDILNRYDLASAIPSSIRDHLKKGYLGLREETPKPGNPVFKKTQNLIIGSIRDAAEAAEAKARELGYNTLLLSTDISGETGKAARHHAETVRRIRHSGLPIPRPACLISGGETTVVIKGTGKGGRNQEFVLASALELEDMEGVLVLSCGTDGTDGPTDAAGAVADGRTVSRAREMGMEPRKYLENNDSYHFFQALNDLVITGPTYTNVMDLRVILVE